MANMASLNSDQFKTPVCTPNKSQLESPTNLIATTKIGPKSLMHEDLSKSPNMECFVDLAASTRKDCNIGDDSRLFMAVAWVNQHELRYFKLYPEVVYLDVTSHTNTNLYHLLTFSCRTATSTQVVFLRMWLPNQRRYTFRWVFQYALKALINPTFF